MIYQSSHTGKEFDAIIDGEIQLSGDKTFVNNVNINGKLNAMKVPANKSEQTIATEEDIDSKIGTISLALEQILGV